MRRILFALFLACSALHASNLPVDFVAHHGQWPEAVRFVARGAVLEDNAISIREVRLRFEGARRDLRPVGAERRGRYNFYISNDPEKWH